MFFFNIKCFSPNPPFVFKNKFDYAFVSYPQNLPQLFIKLSPGILDSPIVAHCICIHHHD